MRKIYLSILLSIAICVGLNAKHVELNYALQVAKNFYQQNTSTPATMPFKLVYECKTNANVGRSSDGITAYYVFDVGENQGFVIVSGDDLAEPVLGYNITGRYTKENLPPALIKWMDNYRLQIVYAVENLQSTSTEITNKWDKYYNNTTVNHPGRSTNSVNPLLGSIAWNQDPYYNEMCPYDNNYSDYCVTGCVATAMAQIMKYWAFPTQGTGFHSYNDPHYGTQSANFGGTTYQWSSMPNSINSSNNAIATLMYHCGVAVDMGYGPGATGGSEAYVTIAGAPTGSACAELAYKTYFGYDPGTIQGILRDNYPNQNDWTSLLTNELDNNRPIQYAGSGQGGGHTWVCDGYDQNGQFHMNWGWGGNSNGYFDINNLSPGALGAGGGTGGFNSYQQAIIGIKPVNGGGGGGGGTINQSNIVLNGTTTANPSIVEIGQQLTINSFIKNAGSNNFTGDFGAAIFDATGVFQGWVELFTSQTLTANTAYTATFVLDTVNLIPGQYAIGIYYRNGSNNYSLMDPTTYANPIYITVTAPYSYIQMGGNSTITPATPVVNGAFTDSVIIGNAGSSPLSGYLEADLHDLDGNYLMTISSVSGTLAAQTSYQVVFSTTGLNVAPGTYYIAYWSTPDQQNYSLVYTQSYPNPVLVTIVDKPINPDIYEQNNTEATAYNLPVSFTNNHTHISTTGSNIHVGNDYDYYKIDLPSGDNYSIGVEIFDQVTHPTVYTDDVAFSYKVNSGNWSDAYDDVLPGPIYVPGGGTVTFFVADYYTGSVGTYLLDMDIARGPNVGINEIKPQSLQVYPNPVNDVLMIKTAGIEGDYELQVFNSLGAVVKQTSGSNSEEMIKTDVKGLASGMYTVQLKTGTGIANSKFIVK